MYNRGDKGGNNDSNHHANMVSDQVVEQMAALAERNDDLEDNQMKLNDAFAQLTRSGIPVGGNGGIPPVIDTNKLMGTAPTKDYSAFMTQQSNQMSAMQALIEDLTKKMQSNGGNSGGNSGGSGGDKNRTKNTNDNKRECTYWR